jgi:hypothetical protein
MSTLTVNELQRLEAADGAAEWYEAVESVRENHGDDYPDDWYERVMQPGRIMDKLKAKWGDPHAFDLVIHKIDVTSDAL